MLRELWDQDSAVEARTFICWWYRELIQTNSEPYRETPP